MSMLNDEITVLKSVMMQVDKDISMIVVYQYHSEKDEYNKVIRDKSLYRYIARVFKTEDLVKKIQSMNEDANRLTKFKWPDDPSPWYTSAEYPENWKIASWLATKLKKIKSWEDGQQALKGYAKGTKTKPAGVYPEKAYAIDGYQDQAGNLVSLTDKQALLKLVGQNLIKIDRQGKSKIKKN